MVDKLSTNNNNIKVHKRKIKLSVGDLVIYFVLFMVLVATLYPLLNVLAISLSKYSTVLLHPFMIFPKDIELASYKWVMGHPLIWSSYKNTIIITIAGVALSMFLTGTYAYALSSDRLKGKSFFSSVLIFTMFFNGGLIPNFYLIQSLGLYNTLGALIIPGSLSVYNAILMINFFRAIPVSLKESARIDGANEFLIFRKIILPLSMPIIATISLFYAVGRWNSFFGAIIYIRDQDKWTLQLLLRELLFAAKNLLDDTAALDLPMQGMKYAVIVVAIVPILCVYPFIQKYFTKGVMLGSIKG